MENHTMMKEEKLNRVILIVDADSHDLDIASEVLQKECELLLTAQDGRTALDLLEKHPISLIFISESLERESGFVVGQLAKRRFPEVDIVFLCEISQIDRAVEGLRAGFSDYLVKPLRVDTLELSARKNFSLRNLADENRNLKEEVELLEECRRISYHIEFQPVAKEALRLFSAEVGATRGFFFWQEGPQSRWTVEAVIGMTHSQAEDIIDGLRGMPVEVPKKYCQVKQLHRPQSSESDSMIQVTIRIGTRNLGIFFLHFPSDAWLTERCLRQSLVIGEQTSFSLTHAYRYKKTQSLVFMDDLTGLYNTRYLQNFVDKELKRAARQDYPVSFLFIDLDHFKPINDRYGHLAGSRTLISVAQEIQKNVRDIDVVARYGGDEYVVILINSTTEGAKMVAERIREQIASRDFLFEQGIEDENRIRVSASIGLATFPDHAKSTEAILRMADEAMYLAKQNRRNQVIVANPPSF